MSISEASSGICLIQKGDNIILAQITGQPRPDQDLLELKSKDFKVGGIKKDSFIRPSFLFTINQIEPFFEL